MRPSVIRSRLALALPLVFTVGWVVYVTATGQWGRVGTVWATSLTMVFGSFVAGSTPQGGGAVAFPVFTKLLQIDGSVARTFSLSIQATGMVMASATILITGRKVVPRAIVLGTIGGLLGFFFGAYVLSDPSADWWAPRIPGPWIKVGFTLAIAAMAFIVRDVFMGGPSGKEEITWTTRSTVTIFMFAVVGGIASSLAGSGADVLLFIFLSAVMGVHPRVGIPTSIITMAIVSVAGLVVFGILGGQLDTMLNADGFVIATPAQDIVTPLAPQRFDLFGIWLGAAPIVVWGAPLGSYVASVVAEKVLIGFVAFMAIAEVLTTIIFLDDLRTNTALAAFGVVGLVVAFGATRVLARTRSWIMATDGGGSHDDHTPGGPPGHTDTGDVSSTDLERFASFSLSDVLGEDPGQR